MPRSELIATSLPDVAAWWSEYGRPGWIAERWLDGEAVWALAGQVRGTYRLEEPGRAPRRLLDAAGAGSFTPLGWYDSLRVTPGAGASWQGFQGALMTVEGRTGGPGPAGAEGIVDLRSGDGAWDENSLMVSRRDTISWLRIESHGLNRGPAGGMDLAGRHTYGVAGGVTRRRHALELSFAEEGVAGRLLGGEQQDRSGQVGSGTYRYARGASGGQLTVARGRTRAVSSGEFFTLDLSRRATASSELEGRVWHRSGFLAGAQWRKEAAARDLTDTFNERARAVWGVAGWAGDVGGGRLTLGVGAGKHSSLTNSNVAPSIQYQVVRPGLLASVGIERVLNAVWNEMVIGQRPFLQRTWVGVADLTVGSTRARQLRAVVLAGRTTARAVASRVPLSDLALRQGLREDIDPYPFGLLSLEGRWVGRRYFSEGQAFGLTRPERTIQPSVDPGVGARAILGSRWSLFTGDLGVRVYAGGDYVGSRGSEFDATRRLPGYATSTLGVILSIADALITIRARNLENVSHEEPWFDSNLQSGAFGPGREFRFALTMVLSN